MKKYKIIFVFAIVAIIGLLIALFVSANREAKRQKANYEAMHDKSLEQELTIAELKEYYSDEIEKLKSVGVKPRQIEHIVETEYRYIDSTIYHDTLIYDTIFDSVMSNFFIRSECTEIRGTICDNIISVDNIKHEDSLIVCLYKQKKQCLFEKRKYRALIYSTCLHDTLQVINNIRVNGKK